jgi:hypothetical protein
VHNNKEVHLVKGVEARNLGAKWLGLHGLMLLAGNLWGDHDGAPLSIKQFLLARAHNVLKQVFNIHSIFPCVP